MVFCSGSVDRDKIGTEEYQDILGLYASHRDTANLKLCIYQNGCDKPSLYNMSQ